MRDSRTGIVLLATLLAVIALPVSAADTAGLTLVGRIPAAPNIACNYSQAILYVSRNQPVELSLSAEIHSGQPLHFSTTQAVPGGTDGSSASHIHIVPLFPAGAEQALPQTGLANELEFKIADAHPGDTVLVTVAAP